MDPPSLPSTPRHTCDPNRAARPQAEFAEKVSEFKGSDVAEIGSIEGLKEWLSEKEGVLIAYYGHECAPHSAPPCHFTTYVTCTTALLHYHTRADRIRETRASAASIRTCIPYCASR